MTATKANARKPLSELIAEDIQLTLRNMNGVVSDKCLKHSMLKTAIVMKFAKLVEEQTWRKADEAIEVCSYFFDVAVDRIYGKAK